MEDKKFNQEKHDLEVIIRDYKDVNEAREWLHRHGYGIEYAEIMIQKWKEAKAKPVRKVMTSMSTT